MYLLLSLVPCYYYFLLFHRIRDGYLLLTCSRHVPLNSHIWHCDMYQCVSTVFACFFMCHSQQYIKPSWFVVHKPDHLVNLVSSIMSSSSLSAWHWFMNDKPKNIWNLHGLTTLRCYKKGGMIVPHSTYSKCSHGKDHFAVCSTWSQGMDRTWSKT